MKKLIILIALITFIVNVNAQVTSSLTTKEIQKKWKPFNPDSIIRVHYDLRNDTAKLFYWMYRIEDENVIFQKRYTDCYIPFDEKDLLKLYNAFNAYIREKHNIK